MTEIHLSNRHAMTCTVVSNHFIEYDMPKANGEFVKVYLCLLRCLQNADPKCSVSEIADHLNHTENDIVRAIRYWEKQGLLSLEFGPNQTISGICFCNPEGESALPETQPSGSSRSQVSALPAEAPVVSLLSAAPAGQPGHSFPASTVSAVQPADYTFPPAGVSTGQSSGSPSSATDLLSSSTSGTSSAVPDLLSSSGTPSAAELQEPRQYTADEITAFSQNPDLEELFFVIATYIKHPLTASDTNFILFWYDNLKFSTELITYLVEYCISKNHSSLRYMNKVAIAWKEEGVETIDDAKEHAAIHSKTYYAVMKALGICGRNLVPAETDFITRWTGEYGFSTEMIQEACSRTISAIHQPSFEYTDSILVNWKKKGVHTPEDVKASDEQFSRNRKSTGPAKGPLPAKSLSADHGSTRFNNFSQRTYDEDELERMLLNRPHNN